MKTTLTDDEKSHIIPLIQAVLDGGERLDAPDLHYPTGALIDAILEIPGVTKNEDDEDSNEGFSTNGWQYDWWQQFRHDGKDYLLSGSGFYGGHTFEQEYQP